MEKILLNLDLGNYFYRTYSSIGLDLILWFIFRGSPHIQSAAVAEEEFDFGLDWDYSRFGIDLTIYSGIGIQFWIINA